MNGDIQKIVDELVSEQHGKIKKKLAKFIKRK
jgi:hypothetical protein